MIIAQITDTHIVPEGQSWLNTPETEVDKRLKLVVERLNTLAPKPDVVLLTGDTVETPTKESYQQVKAILKDLSLPFYVIPGNHDGREEMRAAFVEKDYMPSESFIHYVVNDYPVRMIALDTNVPGEDYGLLCKDRLKWLEDQLRQETHKPTLLFMHHFPMKVGQKAFDQMVCKTEGDFEKLVLSFPNIIGMVAGHYHKTCVSSIGGKTCFVAPSVAPSHYFASYHDEHVTAIDIAYPSLALHRWEEGFKMVSEVVQVVRSKERLPFKKTG